MDGSWLRSSPRRSSSCACWVVVFLRQTTLCRTCLHVRPIRSDYSDHLWWSRGRSRQPSAALRAVYDGRAPVTGTRLKARLLLRTVPGARPSSRTGARALPPRSFLADLDCSSPVFRPKTTRLPHQVCHLDRLGCCPNPCCAPAVFRSQAHCKSSSLAPLKSLQPNLKPAVSGLFVWPVSAAPAVPDGTGLRPRCALSQQVASSCFWLRPTGSYKKIASLAGDFFTNLLTPDISYTCITQKRKSHPEVALVSVLERSKALASDVHQPGISGRRRD